MDMENIYIYKRGLFKRIVELCDEREEFKEVMRDMYSTVVQCI